MSASEHVPSERQPFQPESHLRYVLYIARMTLNGLSDEVRRGLQARVSAEDVVSGALMKATEKFGDYRGQTAAELNGWLATIVKREVADAVRHHTAGKRSILNDISIDLALNESSARLLSLIAPDESTPSQRAERKGLVGMIPELLASLPVDEGEVIWLHFMMGETLETIAEKLGVVKGTASRKMARGLERLRAMMILDEGSGKVQNEADPQRGQLDGR